MGRRARLGREAWGGGVVCSGKGEEGGWGGSGGNRAPERMSSPEGVLAGEGHGGHSRSPRTPKSTRRSKSSPPVAISRNIQPKSPTLVLPCKPMTFGMSCTTLSSCTSSLKALLSTLWERLTRLAAESHRTLRSRARNTRPKPPSPITRLRRTSQRSSMTARDCSAIPQGASRCPSRAKHLAGCVGQREGKGGFREVGLTYDEPGGKRPNGDLR